VNPYWPLIKWGLVAIALVSAYRWAYGNGYDAAELKAAKANDAFIQQEAKRAAGIDERLRKALAAPKAAPVIRRVIHENHSPCSLPAPVAGGLRDAIGQGNAAISR